MTGESTRKRTKSAGQMQANEQLQGPTLLRIRITPRGGRDAITRFEEDILHVRVSAPPVEGAANKALIALIAHTFTVPKSSVVLQSGETSREKVLRLETLTRPELLQRLHHKLQTRIGDLPEQDS